MPNGSLDGATKSRLNHRIWLIAAAAIVALGAVGAIAFILEPRESTVSGFAATSHEPLFPGLDGRIEDVSAIEIEAAGQRLRLSRDGREWRVEQERGYPALEGTVRDFLRAFASLRSAYVAKESRQVGPQYADERSTGAYRVRLIDAGGGEVANARIGHAITVPAAQARMLMPVRRGADEELRLADPVLRVETSSGAWLDRNILAVPRGGVAGFVSESPQGERLEIRAASRRAATQPEQVGRRTEDDAFAAVARGFENLVFDDVVPADELPENFANAGRAEVRTSEGIAYRLELRGSEEETWARISAVPAAQSNESGPDDAAKRAEEFSARHMAWAYRLPPHIVDSLTVKADDLTE